MSASEDIPQDALSAFVRAIMTEHGARVHAVERQVRMNGREIVERVEFTARSTGRDAA